MLTKFLAATALSAFALLPAVVFAADADDTLTLRLTVNPMILLYVTDNTMEMTANDISVDNLDSTGLARPEGRAEFFVAANTGYSITLVPDAVWGRRGSAKVKFVGTANRRNHIAGTLFLDTDMTTDARLPGDTDIVPWDPTGGVSGGIVTGSRPRGPVAGNVSYSTPTRGVRRYGVGAIFDPQDWNRQRRDDLPGAPTEAGSIAPPDVYATTVTVTVSNL